MKKTCVVGCRMKETWLARNGEKYLLSMDSDEGNMIFRDMDEGNMLIREPDKGSMLSRVID